LFDEGYFFGPLVIDAGLFLPQSRPRLFIVATRENLANDPFLVAGGPERPFHPESLEDAFDRAPFTLRQNWRWWKLPLPTARKSVLCDLIESEPSGVSWRTTAETQNLLRMMSPVNQRKIEAAQLSGTRRVGTLYRRTRNGRQCAEVRFDETASCLRTPSRGSSRQTLVIVENQTIRSRLLSPREAARLMGLPDTYRLPGNCNDAYHLAGYGLVVPVVNHLAQHLLTPIAEKLGRARHVAA
jgi:DNA (cytosine-5)-methyltransferase 1